MDTNDVIKCVNFDIIASDDCQEARAVVRGFRLLRMEPFFREIDQKEYIVWMDCGKHFRNNLLAGYLFKELAEEKILGKIIFFKIRYINYKFFF